MANPNNGQLPAMEYIELLNNSTSVKNLGELNLYINNRSLHLPPYLLAPQQFIILCASDGEKFLSRYGNVATLSSWVALNNTGATIQLYRGDVLVDQVAYKDSWHQNSSKKSGGWSLERINPYWQCHLASNWSSSVARLGGTPGAPNSIYDKTAIPGVEITNVKLEGEKVIIGFNTEYMALPEFTKDDFSLNQGELTPTEISWTQDHEYLILTFDRPLEVQKLYRLTVKEVSVCGFNILVPDYLVFKQDDNNYNDIVINEVLFNPLKEGSDFVELYNRTDQPINLQHWRLGNRIISQELLLIAPGGFLVLTAEKGKIIGVHANVLPERVYQMTSFPSYPNQQGVVTLYSTTSLIDSLYYSTDMHSPWVKDPKGISLERQSSENATNSPGNFKSAATIVGGSTPGTQNSTIVDNFSKKNEVFLTSRTVSPDGDNLEEELEINYILDRSDYMLNLQIYNEKGVIIKRLIRHQSVGSGGKITWDCMDDNNKKAPSGHYIYWAEFYTENGLREVYRGAFIVVRKTHYY